MANRSSGLPGPLGPDNWPSGLEDFRPIPDPVKPKSNGRGGEGVHGAHIPPNVSIFGKDVSTFGKNAEDERRGLVSLETVQPEEIQWLWTSRLAFGKLSLLEGDPGLGKSTMLLDIAARITTGSPMPLEHEPCEKGSVLLLSAEDGLADTIVPRLVAAGADLSRVKARVITPDPQGDRLPELNRDLAMLRSDIGIWGVKLVIIDPVVAYLGDTVHSSRDQEVRRVLAPLAMLAEDTMAAMVMVRHLNKDGSASPLYRGGGSIAFIAASRTAFLVAKDTDDDTETRRILACQKNNLAPPVPALAYRLLTHENGSGYVVWEGESHHTAASLLAQPQDPSEKPALNEACEFLKSELAEGCVQAKTIKDEARKAGISEATLRRAKDIVGVKIRKMNFKPSYWVWELPDEHVHEDVHNNNEDAHKNGPVSTLNTFDEEYPNLEAMGEKEIPF
jgi:hypothetical protein